jgi:hypothetical protein
MPICRRIKLCPCLSHHIPKANSKLANNLKYKTPKHETTTGKQHMRNTLSGQKFVCTRPQKAWATKAKINKCDYIKLQV